MQHTLPTRYAVRVALVASAAAIVFGPAALFAAHPPTPPPCAADGTCLPKWTTWGVYKTNWRPWPGDNAGITPTPAASEPSPGSAEDLGGFQLPEPRDETKVGPQAIERDAPADGGINEGVDGGLDEVLDEVLDEIPALDPLGIGQPRPTGMLVQPAAARVNLNGPVQAEYTPVVESEPIEPSGPNQMRILSEPGLAPERPVPLPRVSYKNLGSDDPPPTLPARLRRLASLNSSGLNAVFSSQRDQAVEAASYMRSVQQPNSPQVQPGSAAANLVNPAVSGQLPWQQP
ncbi:hypothetical protein OAS39_10015 [Pirellulales bacterium]|nr:hypothetical protein [Pirellulales bacterium]